MVKVIDKTALISIVKKDSHHTETANELRMSFLNNFPFSPSEVFSMLNPVTRF
jgi:hypothetical protein